MLRLILVVSIFIFLKNVIANTERSNRIIKLRGVTIKNPPYIYVKNNTDGSQSFEGYAVDLINEISNIVGFSYTLYLTPDNKYGGIATDERPLNGLIGEVHNGSADFAVADLTIAETRKKYVAFTVPFMDVDLSALIHEDNVGNITSFAELLEQEDIKYAALRSGSTFEYLRESSDPIITRIYYDLTHGFESVRTREEGVLKTLTSKFAFIQGSVANEYAMDQHCQLRAINSLDENYPREYAIALQKGSRYLSAFNDAIHQLISNGFLDRLKRKYFRRKCLSGSAIMHLSSLCIILSLLLILLTFL